MKCFSSIFMLLLICYNLNDGFDTPRNLHTFKMMKMVYEAKTMDKDMMYGRNTKMMKENSLKTRMNKRFMSGIDIYYILINEDECPRVTKVKQIKEGKTNAMMGILKTEEAKGKEKGCLQDNKIEKTGAYFSNQREWQRNRVTPHNKDVKETNGPFKTQLLGQFQISNTTPKRGVEQDFIGAAGRHQLHTIKTSKITNHGGSSPPSYDIGKDKKLTSKDQHLLREEVFGEMISKANILTIKATKTIIIITVDLKHIKTSKQTTVKETMKNEENIKATGKQKEVTKNNLECEEDGHRKMQQKKKENDKDEESEGKKGWTWWPGP